MCRSSVIQQLNEVRPWLLAYVRRDLDNPARFTAHGAV
jgi:hypothetical protein